VAGLPWNREMLPVWEALGTETEHLKKLEAVLEYNEHRIEFDPLYKLKPERVTSHAKERFLWRMLAQPFLEHADSVPHKITAKLTEVALKTEPIDPHTIEVDILAMKKAAAKQQK